METIVVAGALANKPGNGGEAWVRMSWVEGFRRLGFDVVFVEQVARERTPASAVDYFERTVAEFGLRGAAALLDETGAAVTGLSPEETRERVGEAVALVNIRGNIGSPDCSIPALGTVWRPLPPLVVLGSWPVVAAQPSAASTTVTTWRNP